MLPKPLGGASAVQQKRSAVLGVIIPADIVVENAIICHAVSGITPPSAAVLAMPVTMQFTRVEYYRLHHPHWSKYYPPARCIGYTAIVGSATEFTGVITNDQTVIENARGNASTIC